MRYFWIILLCLALAACSSSEVSPTAEATIEATATTTVTEESALTCESIVANSMQNLETVCDEVGRNEVCYGNRRIDVTLHEGESSSFTQPGDRIPIESIELLSLSPMNEANGEWGFALMEVQADLPDTLPGQNVSFLLFGGTEISPNGEVDGLQAFYIRTGIGQLSACNALPEDGVIIQSPEGDVRVSFSINGVRFELGSTAYLTASDEMKIRLLEGEAVVQAAGESQTIAAGQQSTVPLDESGEAEGAPSAPVAYDAASVSNLPLQNLPRPIEAAPPQAPATVVPATVTAAPETSANAIPEFATADNPELGVLSGEITEANPRDSYSFTAEANQALYIDAHEMEGDMRLTIITPDETLLLNQYWLGIDYGRLVLEDAGVYRIEITAYQGSTEGSYELQIWNIPSPNEFEASIAEATPNNQEGIISGTIPSPAAMNIYTISMEEGQTIYVDAKAMEGDMRINLISPNGTALLNQHWLGIDAGLLELSEGGDYRLEVYGYMDSVGSYEIQIWDVPAPKRASTVIAAATPQNEEGIISGDIVTPGRSYLYDFSAEEGQTIFLDAKNMTGDMRVNLTAPDGSLLLNGHWLGIDAEPLVIPETGQYTLEIYGYLDSLGSYQLQLWDVPQPDESSITIAPNADSQDGIVSGEITTPAASHIYTFEGTEGQAVYLVFMSLEGDMRVTLTSPSGEILLNSQWLGIDSPVVNLPEDGIYTLSVQGYLDALGTYEFHLRED
jgi:hypothetical protein